MAVFEISVTFIFYNAMTAEERLNRTLLQQSEDLKKLYDKLIKQLSHETAHSITEVRPQELYKIAKACNANEKKKVQALLDAYSKAVIAVMQQGIINSVTLAVNGQQTTLASYTQMKGDAVDSWRTATANAFIESRMKRDGGLNLSDRVWNYTEQTKSEFEAAISCVLEDGIKNGIDAETLGRRVRKYLNEPDMMYRRYHRKVLADDGTKIDVVEWRRRVIGEDGKVHFVKEDLAKVGTGVYRSARQNGLRLAITETNMAYNYANCKRWSEEPFVLGIRIRLSGNHPEHDICDELQGEYPKDFMWRGWHPRCRCSQSAILMDRDSEEWEHLRSLPKDEYKKYVSPNAIKGFPNKFNKWIESNEKKLLKAVEKGKLPYFVRDNIKAIGSHLGWNEETISKVSPISSATPVTEEITYPRTKAQILAAAEARHAARTGGQISDILTRWDSRRYSQEQRQNFAEIEKALGIKREPSMDFERANKGRGNIDYGGGHAFRVNCQSSVVAHELRLRGFDVTAQPNWEKGDDPEILSHGTHACWKTQEGTTLEAPIPFAYKFTPKGRFVGLPWRDTLREINEHTQEVGRYHVSFAWKGENYGHIVTMERRTDGTALWYDPQTGERNFLDKEYIKKMKYVRAYRVDNLSFDPRWNVVRDINSPKKRTSFLQALRASKANVKSETNGNTISGTKVNLSKELIAYREKIASEIQKLTAVAKLRDGEIAYSKKTLKRSIVHAKNEAEVDMFLYVVTHANKLQFKKKSNLGETKNMKNPADVKNVLKKRKRGVLFYNEYEIEKEGEVWIVKTEICKNNIETPYNIRKK